MFVITQDPQSQHPLRAESIKRNFKFPSWRLRLPDLISLLLLAASGIRHWVAPPETVMNLHPFRQTQTLWTVREFLEEGWSLAPPMPVLGPPWSVPFEFPLYQLISAVVASATGSQAEYAARLVSLTFFLVSGIGLMYVVREWFSPLAALFAIAVFAFSPFANQWAIATLIEYVPVALILSGIAMLIWQKNTGRAFWSVVVLVAVLISTAAMVKITTFVPWVPVLIVALRMSAGENNLRKLSVSILTILVPAGMLAFAWTRFSDEIKGQSALTVWLQSTNLSEWNFGTLSQRINIENLVIILDRMSSLGAPLLVWLVAIVIGGIAHRWSWQFLSLALVPLLAFSLFFNLYLVHDYYLAAISPSYAAVVGIAMGSVARLIRDRRGRSGFVLVIIPIVLATSLLSTEGRRLAEVWRTYVSTPKLSQNIAEVTGRDDVILVLGCDWDPTVLYYAERKGIALPASWEGPLPSESISIVTHIAGCSRAYEPSPNLNWDHLPEGWTITLVSPGVWKVNSDKIDDKL